MLTREQATNILRLCGIKPDTDFHALASIHVDFLIHAANNLRYRKPRNANGSRARYFHAYLQRRAASEA